MRKIEKQMNEAISKEIDWKQDNTKVVTYSNCSDVFLYNNLIARIGETWMELFDGGYQSNTTKSRLNALLQAFGMEGEYIFQKNFQWFVNYQGAPIPFFSGMRLNWVYYVHHSLLYSLSTTVENTIISYTRGSKSYGWVLQILW